MSSGDSESECFLYILKPGCADRYDELHANVWPEVQEELRASEYLRYDIYRWGDVVITVTERNRHRMPTPVSEHVQEQVDRWAELMAPLFIASTDRDGNLLRAAPVFSLFHQGEHA
ncbi:L-rhamnose mutarotase [Pseudactinotalea sp. Z1739]|uniref:L-rhamnose mutarotase n=1 Tax=Pseudactinotalea sp. Z1739 TaxID=3413028 RepID=UPI003C7BE6FE